MGLTIGQYKGVRQVSHSGSTAGYRAHLLRYPDQHLSVAVLCNASSGAATQYAHAVADVYLTGHIKTPPATSPDSGLGRRSAQREGGGRGAGEGASPALTREQLAAYAGTYVSDEVEASYVVAVDGESLVLKRRPDATFRLIPTGEDTFNAGFARVKFIRNQAGQFAELSVIGSRVFDMRFRRTAPGS